ncbi:toll/interleukin-1 receptor domain-containing protein [Candidatus Accumulibacter vicinus]|uniref:TIR domain protein n=1 Tax=Candidatus Accumulibacter vicinus TaxID=2954382 RepID=A0A084Y2V9_9PROT|nr:toll/interleukin-1 receptor domain-containing protein [Candidatus Accumulibacter vicinus]KFB69053.1 MAG: TIR domain protein [Candidatus Accumulibacter vicinus]
MGSQIFISYSRADKDSYDGQDFIAELLQALRTVPGIRDRLWIDEQGIEVGDRFDDVIQQAMVDSAIAILLVSNHFLNSDYVTRRELPFLLRRTECQGLKLGILYLGAVPDAALSSDRVDHDGKPYRLELLRTHSFNHPTKPLSAMKSRSDRDLLYRKVVEWAGRQLPPVSLPAPQASGPRPELAIFLEARRDHWQHQFCMGTHASPIRPRLDCPAPATVIGYDLDGEFLFNLLFGSDPATFGDLFALAFATNGAAEPTLGPLRVHLLTASEQLHRLPWSTLAYQGRALSQVGWTVEFHTPGEPEFPDHPRHRCHFPGRLLLATCAQRRQAAHFDDLRHFFQRHWPQNPEPALAADADALRGALQVGSTRLVYYYGPASRDGLLLQDAADGGCVSWSELAKWLRESRSVSLLFLNLVNEAGDEALAHGPLLLDTVKGAVLFQCNPRAAAHAAARAGLAWLEAVFSRRIDPVVALHRHGCGHISAWTRYSTWETVEPARLQNPDLVNLLLDRKQQRDTLSGARDEFHTDTVRRIHHVVALGTPGCRTRDFPPMIQQHLVRNQREGEVYYYQSVDLTPGIDDVQGVDDRVRRRFRLTPRQAVLDGLLDREALAGTAFCFLVLGWQAGEASGDAPRLLRTVAEWCRTRLAAELGADGWQARVRVISIVALEAERTDELANTVDELIEAYDAERCFHFARLERLAAVLRSDLRTYFRNETLCGCHDRYREEFPELLLGKRKEMPFDEAVSTIRRGEPDNWGNLVDELKDLAATGAWPPPHYDANFWSRRDAR